MFSLLLPSLLFLASLSLGSPPFVAQNGDLSPIIPSRLASSCPIGGPPSCHNSTAVTNLCCFESPGGLLLQTQFWDTDPSTGPADSWTIHGLWPDNCDATFEQNCDPSRAYTNIDDLLVDGGAGDVLDFMRTHWVDINGRDERFWEHEWSKHGTCMSTLEPRCLQSGSPRGAEAVAFFQTVSLPTYEWLASEGILPTTSKTFSRDALLTALKSASGGFVPALDCNGKNLFQISWYFNLRGSIIDGTFVPIDTPKLGSCPSTGIKYVPKKNSLPPSPEPTTTRPSTPGPRPTSAPPGDLPAKATIHALPVRSEVFLGGLLSAATWSTQPLATFTLKGSSESFTMSSSKGDCGVINGALRCGSNVESTTFSAVASSGRLLLASGGSTAWTSDGVPSGKNVYTVFTGTARDEDYSLAIIRK
ncbi:hypothetical protein ONZ45_g219 [Pleurotus djamor]|nr:hypothetical protein ONZ45_g219 [Pleurotus djamor]